MVQGLLIPVVHQTVLSAEETEIRGDAAGAVLRQFSCHLHPHLKPH